MIPVRTAQMNRHQASGRRIACILPECDLLLVKCVIILSRSALDGIMLRKIGLDDAVARDLVPAGPSFGLDQQQAKDVLAAAGVDERVRGEALSLEELCRVADAIFEIVR